MNPFQHHIKHPLPPGQVSRVSPPQLVWNLARPHTPIHSATVKSAANIGWRATKREFIPARGYSWILNPPAALAMILSTAAIMTCVLPTRVRFIFLQYTYELRYIDPLLTLWRSWAQSQGYFSSPDQWRNRDNVQLAWAHCYPSYKIVFYHESIFLQEKVFLGFRPFHHCLHYQCLVYRGILCWSITPGYLCKWHKSEHFLQISRCRSLPMGSNQTPHSCNSKYWE